MNEAKTNAVKKYEAFLSVVESKIQAALDKGVNLPATLLAKELCESFNWKWPQAYHFINAYVDEREDLCIKLGPKGGICLKSKE